MSSAASSNDTAPTQSSAAKTSRTGAWTGLAAVAFAIGYGFVGASYGVGSARAPGAGLFPVLVALLVGGAGAFMVVSGLLPSRKAAGESAHSHDPQHADEPVDDAQDDEAEDGRRIRDPRVRVATVLGILIAYVIAVTWIGHLITTIVVATIAVLLLGTRPWWQAAAFSVAIALATQLLFGSLLGLPLPLGLYGPRW